MKAPLFLVSGGLVLASFADYQPEPWNLEARRQFADQRFGIFIHWGLYANYAQGEWYLQQGGVEEAAYARMMHGFCPSKFDAKEWVRIVKGSGARYLTITSRHHDGFSLWPTKADDGYNIGLTPFKRDILGELAAACRRRGMHLGFYYSNPDWNHPNAYNPKSSHQTPPEPGDRPDMDAYVAFVKTQITELMSNYGEICCLFWDIPTKIERPELNALVRQLQPNILIDNRGWGEGGDYSTPEREAGKDADAAFEGRVEACDSVGAQSWGYRVNEDYHTVGYLTRAIDRYLSRGGNFLLNVGPKADGTLTEDAKRLLAEVGRWYRAVKDSYRDVTTVPKAVADKCCVVTRRGEMSYFHFCGGLDASGVDLMPIKEMPRSVRVLNTGAPLKFAVETLPRNWQKGPSLHVWDIPADALANECVILEVRD